MITLSKNDINQDRYNVGDKFRYWYKIDLEIDDQVQNFVRYKINTSVWNAVWFPVAQQIYYFNQR